MSTKSTNDFYAELSETSSKRRFRRKLVDKLVETAKRSKRARKKEILYGDDF
ncbi:MAG TPA: hypothetical protein VMR49_00485 [Candidatus Paceibacterota bacterium]|jgi:hypothetical protein|nr:hypothetical protein [Candidatus Paceibacterota bacterium]